MSCEAVRERLGELLVEALDAAEVLAVETHLASCGECREELAALERLEAHLAPARESLAAELWLFLREEKRYWLVPLVLALFGLSAVVVLAEGSAIAPFIYSIF